MKSSIFNICKQIEDDVSKLDVNPDIFKWFDPLMWIESNEKLFFLTIMDLSANNNAEVYISLLTELSERFTKILNANNQTPYSKLQSPALMTLILWTIIHHISIKKCENAALIDEVADLLTIYVILDYSQVHFSYEFIYLFQKLHQEAIKITSFIGTSVISKVFTKIDEMKTDPIIALNQLSTTICSGDTLKYFISNSEKIISTVSKQDRPIFFEKYYEIISHFLVNHPQIHQCFVIAGLEESTPLFTSLSKSKVIESQLYPILCLLLSFITPRNKVTNDKAKKFIQPIFKAIQGFGSKKDPTVQYYYMAAFVELVEGLFFSNDLENEPFISINKFYEKNVKEFENILYQNISDSHPDPSLLSLLTRYSVYDFIHFKDKERIEMQRPIDFLIEKSVARQSWSFWERVIQFFIHIFSKWSHHPRYKSIVNLFNLPQKNGNKEQIFRITIDRTFQICKSCIGIINRILDDDSCAKFVSKLVELFEFAPIDFSVYSSFELQYSEYTTQKEIRFPYQTEFLFEETVEFDIFIKFLLGLVSMPYKVKEDAFMSVVSCLRNIWTFNKKTVEGKDNKAILNHVSDIVKYFTDVIKTSIDEFFNDLMDYHTYPYLFYRFLHWSYNAIKATLGNDEKSSRYMTASMIQNFLNASLIIHAIASDQPTKQLADNCDRIIKEIVQLYNVNLTDGNFISYSTITDSIEGNATLLTSITGEMFDFWLKFVQKQIDEVEKTLFIDKQSVNESGITHAFLASSVSSPLFSSSPSLVQQSSTSISICSISSISNPSLALSSNNNSSTFLLVSSDQQIRKLITNQHLISSVTSFLCKFICTLKNDVFNKLINKINFSSKIGENINANENENVLKEFFSACISYVNALPRVDKSFTSSFAYLSDDSVRIFIDLSASRLLKRVQNFQYDRPYFWLNFIHICITLASRRNLTSNIIQFINDVIPIFFSTIEFNVFPNTFLANLMNSICVLISTFNKYISRSNNNDKDDKIFDPSILYSKQRLTIYSILEICINFANNDQQIFLEILPTVLSTLSSLFKNLNLNVTSSNNHVDDVSSEDRFMRDVIFFLSFFNACIQQTTNVDVIFYILKCMNYIINNNPSAWPVYSYFANTSNQLFKGLLIESLTLVCGAVYHSQTDYESMIAPLDEKASSQKDKTILKSQREKMEVNYLLYSVKTKMEATKDDYDVFELTRLFPYKKLTQPFGILTDNNFNFFKTLNIFNLRFIESCISCVVYYNMHDKLFEEMIKLVKNNTFDSQNSVSVFFNAWWLYSVRKWQLIPLINSVSVEEPINFINKFDPPPFFVYYISKFAKLTSTNLCKEMFLKCFLKPLIFCPLTYDVKKFIPNDKAEEFINKLIKLPQYETSMSIMLETEMLYPVIDNEYFPKDRNLVLSFISERPKAIDKLYGTIDKESYNKIQDISEDSQKIGAIQDINFLSVCNWIKDAGTINDSRVIYIKISSIRRASPTSIASDFFNHFPSSTKEKLIFFVDLSSIPEKDAIFEAFLKITEQATDEFTSRIEKIYLVNPSMDTTQLLNEKLSDIIQLNWVNKYEIVDDIKSIIPKDSKVYLPISLFGGVSEQKYSFNAKYQNEMASFSVCDDYFILSTNRSLFINNNIINRIRFPISSINSLKDVNDNKGRCVMIQAHYSSTGTKDYRIETEHSNAILFVYNLLEQRYNFGLSGILKNRRGSYSSGSFSSNNNNVDINALKSENVEYKINEILLTTSPSLQSQMLAFSIYQMSFSDSIKALGFQVYQLFECAFNFDQTKGFQLTKSMPFDRENLINLSVLYNMIEKKSMDLLEDVAYNVSLYLNSNTTSESIQNLIPLFIKFINTTSNKSKMSQVLCNILKTSKKQPHISILERFFFSKFTSNLAFEITIPILIRAAKGIKSRELIRSDGTIENVYIEIYMQSLMNPNPKLVCEIIEKNLNGAVSKRSFAVLFPTDKVLSTIISLPFHSREFLANNLGLFFFCSLLEGIYDSSGVINYTKKCYSMIFSLLLHFKSEEVPNMKNQIQMIMKLIENLRILKLSELISCIDQLLTLLDKSQHETFRHLLTNTEEDQSIRNWYIKGFAESYFGKGNFDTAIRFIKMMPDLYITPPYGFQKLAICFDSFEILIKNDQMNNDKQIPLQLFWASLIASTHQNTRLRESSLTLLQTIMSYLYTKSDNKIILNCIDEVINSRNESDAFNVIISEFEKLMDVDFENSFCLSVISILVKGMSGTDVESRKKPNDFFKWCFKSFKNDLKTSIMFLLPLLIFENSFYYTSTTYSVSSSAEISSFLSNSENASKKICEWANNALELNDSNSNFKSIQDLIFYEFDQRNENEQNWIILFLDRFFGESSCPYCVGVIADTIMYGVGKYGNIMCRINRSIIDKCQTMIDNLRSLDGVEKLSIIIASFVDASNKITVTQTEITKDIYRRIEKEKTSDLIVKIINEIERLSRKR